MKEMTKKDERNATNFFDSTGEMLYFSEKKIFSPLMKGIY
jgi:hypothetical protein